MDKNSILVATIALLVGFIGGFFLANSLNRSEMNAMRSQAPPAAANANGPANNDDPSLSQDEIKAKVEEADKNPDNFNFQRDLGVGLYRYGAMKQDLGVLAEAARILARANSLDPKDVDVLVNLGNAHFDIGFAKKDQASFDKAREFYTKAIAIRPDDPNVRTDLGISYYVQPVPDYSRAASELQKVVEANPRHDRSMQFLAEVYVAQNKIPDAEKLLAKIKEANPTNPAIKELSSHIEAAKNGIK